MRITIVNLLYPPGAAGLEEVLAAHSSGAAWAAALAAAGAEVTVLQRFHRDDRATRQGVRYELIADGGGPWPRPWRIPARLLRAAAGLAGDIVHLDGQLFPVQALALRLALPRRSALVVQHHAGDPPAAAGIGGLARRAAERLGLRAADGWLFQSAELAESWRAAGLIRPGAVVCAVPEAGSDLAPIERGAARASARLRGAPALLWVGRLHPVKDPLTVLEGLARAGLPGACLTMAFGSAELRGAVEARSARPDLAGRVELRGLVARESLAALYSAADIFVLGSRREGSGYALIEALACGLPPAVTDIPAFRAICGGAAGAHWRAGDPASCAAALADLAGRGEAAGRGAARARFEEALSWPAVARQALAAYERVAAGRRGGAACASA